MQNPNSEGKTRKPDPVDIQVGGQIRLRRRWCHMSQTALGKAIGVTFQQVQKYEKGTNRVGASRLNQIANVLNVAPSFFFEGMPGHNSSKPNLYNELAGFLSSEEGIALNRAFVRIRDAKVRRRLSSLVEQLGANEHEMEAEERT